MSTAGKMLVIGA